MGREQVIRKAAEPRIGDDEGRRDNFMTNDVHQTIFNRSANGISVFIVDGQGQHLFMVVKKVVKICLHSI